MTAQIVVLDASALLAVMQREPGQENVRPHLRDAVISAVNVSEVIAKLVERGMPPDDAATALLAFGLDIRPFDAAQAVKAGAMRLQTRSLGLSLGDRACSVLAASMAAKVLTTDRAWAGLPNVELIR